MGKHYCRGQAAVEYIFVVGSLIMVFSIVLMLSIQRTSESSQVKTNLDAARIGISMRDNINAIAQQGVGYYRYFTLPEYIKGYYDYNVSVNNHNLQIIWDTGLWSTSVMPTNVSFDCISKGSTKPNRVYYAQDGLRISCYRPNLIFNEKSFTVDGNRSFIELKNDAHVGADSFLVFYITNVTAKNLSITKLDAWEAIYLEFNITGAQYLSAYADIALEINESREFDNNFTVNFS